MMTLYGSGNYEGQLLLATPQLQHSCFAKSVVYVCAHNKQGAMGLIVNHALKEVDIGDIIKQFSVGLVMKMPISMPVHFGGPVEPMRGFVLHTPDYTQKETLTVKESFCVTSSIEILSEIAEGRGPKQRILALGYAGWSAGQLEKEIQENSWITAPANESLVFDKDNESKWLLSAKQLGVSNPYMLSNVAGHA